MTRHSSTAQVSDIQNLIGIIHTNYVCLMHLFDDFNFILCLNSFTKKNKTSILLSSYAAMSEIAITSLS